MRHLAVLNKYFVRYRWRLLLGIIFVSISNIFAILPPGIIRDVLDKVYDNIHIYHLVDGSTSGKTMAKYIMNLVMIYGLLLLAFALLKGIFMFFMRQTIIVMSRHIEYDQKNEVFAQYQKLSTAFFKSNRTGDLMNRISEDVSRVRMYTGPAIMYGINLIILTGMCVYRMFSVNATLAWYVIVPLPLLAFSIYYVNRIVNRKGEVIQRELSDLTTHAQEAYSGIRVIKSFGEEDNSFRTFSKTSQSFRKSAISLGLTEAIYFPSMNLFVGLSMLSTILIGGYQAIQGNITPGNIAEFVIYINLLTFPISAIGWTANMIQRAATSQRRINEFLLAQPDIANKEDAVSTPLRGVISFQNVSFTYPNTGITALKKFNLEINHGEKVAIIGSTGSGKSTIIHLLLRMYETTHGNVLIDGWNVRDLNLDSIRKQIALVPQEILLFSDTIANNIALGNQKASAVEVEEAAKMAAIHEEIEALSNGYQTLTGERGVMLSGGQKQRISIARALLKTNTSMFIMDDSLSAVDTRTEQEIQKNLREYLQNKTTIVITHRIFKHWDFDKIIVMDEGQIIEEGNHNSLMKLNGTYAKLYHYQMNTEQVEKN